MRTNRDNLKWAARMMLILFLAGLTNCLVVAFASHPLPWAALIPSFVPLLTGVVAIIPMLKANREASLNI